MNRPARVSVAVALVALGLIGTAGASKPQPDRFDLVSMARYYHCNIVGTPGLDYFHGNRTRGWIIGGARKGYFIIDPALVGWEPHGRDWIKAVCQFGPKKGTS